MVLPVYFVKFVIFLSLFRTTSVGQQTCFSQCTRRIYISHTQWGDVWICWEHLLQIFCVWPSLGSNGSARQPDMEELGQGDVATEPACINLEGAGIASGQRFEPSYKTLQMEFYLAFSLNIGDPPLLSPALKTLSTLMGSLGLGNLVRLLGRDKAQLSIWTKAEATTADCLHSGLGESVTAAGTMYGTFGSC